jgi:hypothetical protein
VNFRNEFILAVEFDFLHYLPNQKGRFAPFLVLKPKKMWRTLRVRHIFLGFITPIYLLN